MDYCSECLFSLPSPDLSTPVSALDDVYFVYLVGDFTFPDLTLLFFEEFRFVRFALSCVFADWICPRAIHQSQVTGSN